MQKRIYVFRLICVFIGVFSLGLGVSAQTAAPTPNQPMLLGINYSNGFWHDNERAALAQLPLGIVRWGGGPSDINDNAVGLVQRFLADIKTANNSVPIYQVPYLYELPENLAKQVTDANITNKLGIKYWEIGNEPELFKASHFADVTLDDYLKTWRADAQAMLAIDPTITLVGPDVSLNLTPINKSSRAWQWFDAFIKTNGDMIGVVTLHFYPYDEQDLTPDQIFANIDTFDENLKMIRSYLHDTLKRDLPLMITEVNLSARTNTSTNTDAGHLYAGLWLADMLGKSAQQGVAAVLPWTAVRNGGLSILDDAGVPHPTYYAIQMWAGLGRTVETPDGLPKGVDGYHSQADSGEAIEVLINRNAQPTSITVASTSLTLKPYSMTRLHFDKSGKLTDGTTYSQSEFDAKKPPSDALH